MKRLLLISSSYVFGRGYLDHCAEEIVDFLGSQPEVLFVPFALRDQDSYATLVEARFQQLGYRVVSLHRTPHARSACLHARALFVGGGNTFRLLKALWDQDLLNVIRQRIFDDLPYIGTSAGSNIAGPTIQTTNDMPIVRPPSFDALGLVPFHINPHYFENESAWKVMMESRSVRIREFQDENDSDVVAMHEASFLRIEGESLLLKGSGTGKLFLKDGTSQPITPVKDLSFLGGMPRGPSRAQLQNTRLR